MAHGKAEAGKELTETDSSFLKMSLGGKEVTVSFDGDDGLVRQFFQACQVQFRELERINSGTSCRMSGWLETDEFGR